MDTDQAREAIAAHLISGDEDFARQVAADLTPGQLLDLAIGFARMYAFGLVTAFEQQPGVSQDEAKRMALDHFRNFARFHQMRGEGDQP